MISLQLDPKEQSCRLKRPHLSSALGERERRCKESKLAEYEGEEKDDSFDIRKMTQLFASCDDKEVVT